MRKVVILLAGVLLLSGCGRVMKAPAAEMPEPEVEEWGVFDASSIRPVLQQRQAPELTPEPKQKPVLSSLSDIYPETATVWLDGVSMKGLLIDGAVLMEAGQWTERWDWFRGNGDKKTWVFTGNREDKKAGSAEIECVVPEQFDGMECIFFEGITEEYWIPAEWVALQFGVSILKDTKEETVYLTSWVDTEDIPTGISVPILMYHAVSDDLWGIEELFVSPAQMRAQLEYLIENGYDPIFFSDLSHLSEYDHPVILTFDDGYEDNYTELFPLLEEYGVKATVFVITGLLDHEHYLTTQQVKEMANSGIVDIQSHTMSHEELEFLDYDAQEEEIAGSQLALARITGKIPYVIAYPSGSRNEDTLAIVPEYYTFGVDMNGGVWYTGESWFKVDRIYISRWDTMDVFVEKLP